MKISNEAKVGGIAIAVIALFILGFNFLKGNKVFSKKMNLYANYTNIQGLNSSNPVVINGMQVGIVKEIINDKNMKEMTVLISIDKDINIPKNSVALIVPNPLAVTKIDIKLGDEKNFLKNNDTLLTEDKNGLLEDVMKKVDPVLFEVKEAVSSLDSLMMNVNSIIDPRAKNNIGNIINNLEAISNSLLTSTLALQQLLDKQSGSLSKTIDNVNSFTGNLSKNNEKINSVIDNLDKTSSKLSQVDLQKILSNIDKTVEGLKITLDRLNSKEGSLGMLINDPSLYKNISSTSNKVNLLLDDIRVHPKRYVNISVFGKKNTEQPLSSPLADTVNSPYLPK